MLTLLLHLVGARANGACTEITNCDSCTNPPLKCYSCPSHRALRVDQTGCLDCPLYCDVCSADVENEVKCATCAPAYVLEITGTCTSCGPGCLSCHYDNQRNLVCDECDVSHLLDIISIMQTCIQCGSNCRKCEIQMDGSTKCLTCNGMEIINATT